MIKSMSKKKPNFHRLINYMGKGGDPFVIGNNLRTTHLNNFQSVENEFLKNYRYCPNRKNGVALYHEIMSFSKKDTKNLNEHILRDLGSRYLEQRATNALGYAKVHRDKDHVHIHFMISANLIESPKKLRLSKAEFHRIKQDLELYQKQKYPNLKHSICQEKTAKRKITRNEGEISRKGKITQKERIVTVFQRALNCTSKAHFLQELKINGLKLYQRGETWGLLEIKTQKKYRLKTLGVWEAFLKTPEKWQRFKDRTKEIGQIKEIKNRRQLQKAISYQIS